MSSLSLTLVLSLALLGAVPTTALEDPQSSYDPSLAESLGADERGMRSYVLVVLKTGPTPVPEGEKRKEMFRGHFANMQRLAEEGKLVLAGPLDGVDGWRGLFVFATPDIEAAESFVATDPVIENGEMVAEFHAFYGSAALMMMNEIGSKIFQGNAMITNQPEPGRIVHSSLVSRLLILAFVLLGAAFQAQGGELPSDRVILAQRYFRALYCGDPEALDDLAAPEIVISYPVFAEVLGTPAIRGREAAKAFGARFSQRWTHPELEFHESLSDGDRVVFIWSFAARRAADSGSDAPASAERSAWGGITLIRFDGRGKIVAEIGEESTPGPIGRLREAGSE